MFLITLLLIGFSSIAGIIIYLLHKEQKDSKILREIEYNKFIAENNFQHSKFKQSQISENKTYNYQVPRKSKSKQNQFYSSIPKSNTQQSSLNEQPTIIYDEHLLIHNNADNCNDNHKNITDSHYHHVNNHSHDRSSDYSHSSSDYSHFHSSDNYSSDYSSSDCGSDFGGSFD